MTRTGSTWVDGVQWSGSTTLRADTLAVMASPAAPECGWEHIPNDLTLATLRDGAEGKNLVWFNSADEFFAGLYDDE